jgi:hypothetical protein
VNVLGDTIPVFALSITITVTVPVFGGTLTATVVDDLLVGIAEIPLNKTLDMEDRLAPVMVSTVFVVPVSGELLVTLGIA